MCCCTGIHIYIYRRKVSILCVCVGEKGIKSIEIVCVLLYGTASVNNKTASEHFKTLY